MILEYLGVIRILLVLAFGLSIGSFLNVVVYRLPRGLSVVKPRSKCPGCGNMIAWYDNIPVLSYLMLGASCRHCHSPISIRYPLIELATGLLAVACYYRFGFSLALVFYFLFAAALVAITFIDISFQIIPNEISLPAIPLGIACALLTNKVTWFDSVMGAVVGFSLIALIAYGYYFLTHREGIGLGDAKLLAMMGAFLGWPAIPFILLAGSVQGLVVALTAIGMGWMRKAPPLPDPTEWKDGEPPEPGAEVKLRHAAVPFGPFLALAGLEFMFFGGWFYQALNLIRF